jgi:WD40 repeat protein
LYPLPGMPMGPHTLVREPAELADASSWTIETHSERGTSRAVAYQPDGKILATGGDDGTVRLWNTANGELVRMLVGATVQSLSWSRDGKLLAAGNGDGEGRLWEADTGRLLRRLPSAQFVAWSPDGPTLGILFKGSLRVWDANTARDVWVHEFGPLSCQAIAWSPDGKRIAVSLSDKSVRLCDAVSGKETRKLEGHESPSILGLAWSPDGKRLVSAAPEEAAGLVWNADTGTVERRIPVEKGGLMGHSPVTWSPDGKQVVIGGQTPMHWIHDPSTGRRLRPLDAGDALLSLAWSPDGKQVATAGGNGVRLHDAATGKRTRTLHERTPFDWFHWLAWSPDSRRLGLGATFAVAVVDAATGQRRLSPPGTRGSCAWSPDGKTLAAVRDDLRVGLWDADTNRLLRTLEVQSTGLLAWSADGKMLAGSSHNLLWVCSTETGKALWQNDKYPGVGHLAWSPDGSQLATTDYGWVRFFEAGTGKLLREAPLSNSGKMAWSPDGKTLAVNFIEFSARLVTLIDAATGTVRVRVPGEPIHWSADGHWFSTAVETDTGTFIHFWDAAAGKPLGGKPLRSTRVAGTPVAHANLAWSPDGRALARNRGYGVYLYNDYGHLLGVLVPGDAFGYLAISADGHYRGNARLERAIRMVVQKRDGTSETLMPAEFEQRYGFKNDPAKLRLLAE